MSALAELLARLDAGDADAHAAANLAGHDEIWVPNDGPQTEAYFSVADETFYGGQAGGGKTDLELGLALTQHRRSLILRRINVDAVKLVNRLEIILGTRNGYNGQSRSWRLPDGRRIDFGGCELEVDKHRYKGEPHDLICVGRGTPVLLANGTYCPVEELRAGQMLATLEGARRLQRAYPAQIKSAVQVIAFAADGHEIGRQIQSTTHELLTEAGWLSVADLGVSCASNEFDSGDRFLGSWRRTLQSIASRLVTKLACLARNVALALQGQDRRADVATAAFAAPRVPGSDYAASCDQRRVWSRPALWCALPGQRSPALPLWGRDGSSSSAEYEARGELKSSSPEDLQDHCSSGSDLCGGRTPRPSDSWSVSRRDRRCLLLRADAEQPNPIHWRGDGSERTHTPNRPLRTYRHPYTNETRSIDADGSLLAATLKIAPVGMREVYDLQVDEVNHYITSEGFINKNCFDEGSDFLYSQYRFIIGWLRSEDPTQRCRVVVASNPPLTAQGLWVIQHWAPWLDRHYPRPARPGELRWFLATDDGDVEVDGRGPHEIRGRQICARSRTFIPSSVEDNPDYALGDYRTLLDNLPDELRRAYREGDFTLGQRDDDFQCIPTAWIEAAMQRWTEKIPPRTPMTAMAVDVAPGGGDQRVICWRYVGWFAPFVAAKEEDKTGRKTASAVVLHRRDRCPVVVDLGGGWGGDALIAMKDNGIEVIAFNGVQVSSGRTRDGKIKFRNKRAEAVWRFREALDPSQEGGSIVALPPDPELKADLAGYRWENTLKGILIEPKEKMKERLGRSPDKGDAAVMCLSEGNRAVERIARAARGARPLVANTGGRQFASIKR